jgi:signal transduction histidine kinase
MIWNWLRRHPVLTNVAVVALLCGLYVATAAHQLQGAGGVVLALLQTLPLLWRRSRPFAALALVTAGAVASGIAYDLIFPFAPAVAVYTVADQKTRGRSAAAAAGAILAIAAAAGSATDYARLVIVAAGWVVGDNLRTRRAYLRELEEKAERLERERRAETARATAEEQARIARELHDVIAHSVSVMVVQAAAARDVFESAPERARAALEAIESTGRSALGDLRRVLGIVRGDAEYAPAPGLARVEALLDTVRAAGLDVRLTVEGSPREVPPGVDLSAYRVVQEALTNTLKHAGARHVDVAIRYDDALTLEISDDGVGLTNGSRSVGRGLEGMRERAAMVGGTLDTREGEGGGFFVRARFPLAEASR